MNEKNRIMSLSAVGLDSPGLVSKITTKVYEMKGNVLDVEENCRRGLFSIFLIIDFSSSHYSDDEITRALKQIEHETTLRVNLGIYDVGAIPHGTEKEHHLVTILGLDQPGIIAKISTFFHGYNINIETTKMIAHGNFFSMEMLIDTSRMRLEPSGSRENALEKMKEELQDLCADINQSVVIQSENIYKRTKKLVVFDVESSLIQDSSFRHFLDTIKTKIQSINGKAEFRDAEEDSKHTLTSNARAMKGLPISELEKFSEILQLNPGAMDLIHILKSMGFKIALLSSGFRFFIKRIFEEAGVDYAFSNTLKVDDQGLITGELEEPMITSESKQEILDFIMHVESINSDQVIAVGDGSTRSHFIENVGLSIAFKPDEPRIKTDGILSTDQIINVLYCLGIPKEELDKHLSST